MEIMKLAPVFKDYIWGGTRLKDDFGFKSDLEKVAEGWMLSCHKDGMNTIEGGEFNERTLSDVIDEYSKETVVGTNSFDFTYFPVLIKLIDAKDNLSIQVHPDNEYAQRVEGEYGKTEIWYVLDATDDAKLIYGFKNKISSEKFEKSIENNTLLDELNVVNVKKGDLFFIEAGTVHAIGKGALIAEIQQNSNTTYRVYDYGRVGADNKPRELHIKKAVDVAKTEPPKYDIKPQGKPEKFDGYIKTLLCSCPLFTVNRIELTEECTLFAGTTSFHHILVTEGSGTLCGKNFKKGDSFFVPAGYGEYQMIGNATLLITHI